MYVTYISLKPDVSQIQFYVNMQYHKCVSILILTWSIQVICVWSEKGEIFILKTFMRSNNNINIPGKLNNIGFIFPY